jgi:hypothetical protein
MRHPKRIDFSKPRLAAMRPERLPDRIVADARRIEMGAPGAIRLGDLNNWHRVRVRCFACNRRVDLKPSLFKFGRSDRDFLDPLAARLRCVSCGNNRENMWHIVLLPRNH